MYSKKVIGVIVWPLGSVKVKVFDNFELYCFLHSFPDIFRKLKIVFHFSGTFYTSIYIYTNDTLRHFCIINLKEFRQWKFIIKIQIFFLNKLKDTTF